MYQMFHRYWRQDPDLNHCAVYEDGCFICSGLSWSQATRFCGGASLFDVGVTELSLF